jgi:hypothetical protein
MGPLPLATLMTPALMSVPSMPTSISRVKKSAAPQSCARSSSRGSSQCPVHHHLHARLARSPQQPDVAPQIDRRDIDDGVEPLAFRLLRMSTASATNFAQPPNSCGQACQMPADVAQMCSCDSVRPSLAVSIGPARC